MARTHVSIDEQTKQELDKFKDRFRAKTPSDTIDKLMRSYISDERQRQETAAATEKEKQRAKAEDIHLGAELKTRVAATQERLGFRSPAHLVDFLLDAFEGENMMSRKVFELYVQKVRR